ncbi:sulfurtransferase [Leucothrix pacifica]|uniref:Sulfurtransferase n=2 Tax=Leucothrix pacifica TaxID=1247513 RepID=A0A317C166_9GAMM|nr:sulfurtransferase [Leucothrix pacifica]
MMIAEQLAEIQELFPWDIEDFLTQSPETLIVDIRESEEVATGAIKESIHVPRGVLESACDWGYSDTVPALVQARDKPVVLVCRSGNRSALAAYTLQLMGYTQVYSLKTGIRGWNDDELPLYDKEGRQVDVDVTEELLSPPVRADQLGPASV